MRDTAESGVHYTSRPALPGRYTTVMSCGKQIWFSQHWRPACNWGKLLPNPDNWNRQCVFHVWNGQYLTWVCSMYQAWSRTYTFTHFVPESRIEPPPPPPQELAHRGRRSGVGDNELQSAALCPSQVGGEGDSAALCQQVSKKKCINWSRTCS